MKTINTYPLKTSKASTLAFILLLSATATKAQTAANWNFNSTNTATTGSNITAPSTAFGSAIGLSAFNGGGEYYGENGWPSGAIDPNAYLEFSASPNTGYYLILNTVTMVIRRSNTGTPQGAGPNSWTLRSSLDGYTTDLATNSMTYNYATYTVTLPAAFQGLTLGVTFRLYGFNTTVNSGGNSRFVYDNISIQGQANPGLLAAQSIDLSAKSSNKTVSLEWLTAGFADGTAFTVERSTDGASFTAISAQIASGTNDYQYIDNTLPAAEKIFYRVRAQQPDGATLISAIKQVTIQTTTATIIRSIATAGSSVKTMIHLATAGSYQLNIWSRDGKAIQQQNINGQAGDQTMDLALSNNPRGLYILTLSKDGVNTSRQFLY